MTTKLHAPSVATPGLVSHPPPARALPRVDVDVAGNRRHSKYGAAEQAMRVAWSAGRLLLVLSPRPMFALRRFVLRCFGARIGRHVHVYPSSRFYMPWNLDAGDWAAIGEDVMIYNLGRVSLGSRATLSYRSHVCAGTHDLRDPAMPLLKPPVCIADGAWVGTEAFIGPGVTVAGVPSSARGRSWFATWRRGRSSPATRRVASAIGTWAIRTWAIGT
jgi:putative colanic acid biosynthesis acetyltransferase WcaF